MLRAGRAALIGLGLALLGAACSDDEAESDYQCCVVQALCDLCSCDAPTQGIADSGDEARCKQYLVSGEWECIGGDELDAREMCAGR
jgi:hypothetical protein